MSDRPRLYTLPEVAEILGTNADYVRALRKAGLLRTIKLGRHKVRAEELARFLADYEGWDVTDPAHPRKLEGAV